MSSPCSICRLSVPLVPLLAALLFATPALAQESPWPLLEPDGPTTLGNALADPANASKSDPPPTTPAEPPVVPDSATPGEVKSAPPATPPAQVVVQEERRNPRWDRFMRTTSAKYWLLAPGYTVGAVTHGGRGSRFAPREAAGAPGVMGYHFQERNGFVSGAVLAGLLYICGAFGAAAVAAPPTETTSWTTTDASGQRWRHTKTRATGPGDMEGGGEALQATESSAGAMVRHRMQNFELSIYSTDWMGRGLGETLGFRANFMAAFPLNELLALEVGYGMGRTLSYLDETQQAVESRFSGMPVRLLLPMGPLMAQLGMDLNFRSVMEATFWSDRAAEAERDGVRLQVEQVRPWPVSMAVHALVWRFHLTVGVESARVLRRDFGTHAALGLRF